MVIRILPPRLQRPTYRATRYSKIKYKNTLFPLRRCVSTSASGIAPLAAISLSLCIKSFHFVLEQHRFAPLITYESVKSVSLVYVFGDIYLLNTEHIQTVDIRFFCAHASIVIVFRSEDKPVCADDLTNSSTSRLCAYQLHWRSAYHWQTLGKRISGGGRAR